MVGDGYKSYGVLTWYVHPLWTFCSAALTLCFFRNHDAFIPKRRPATTLVGNMEAGGDHCRKERRSRPAGGRGGGGLCCFGCQIVLNYDRRRAEDDRGRGVLNDGRRRAEDDGG